MACQRVWPAACVQGRPWPRKHNAGRSLPRVAKYGKEIMTKTPVRLSWQRAIVLLTITIVGAVAIGALYWCSPFSSRSRWERF